MKVITVCGSMRFVEEMIEIAEKLELEGNCVLMPIYNPNRPNKDAYSKEEAIMLDKGHKKRIDLADSILVVDVDGYIGSSTQKEIEYAKALGKEVLYYTNFIK